MECNYLQTPNAVDLLHQFSYSRIYFKKVHFQLPSSYDLMQFLLPLFRTKTRHMPCHRRWIRNLCWRMSTWYRMPRRTEMLFQWVWSYMCRCNHRYSPSYWIETNTIHDVKLIISFFTIIIIKLNVLRQLKLFWKKMKILTKCHEMGHLVRDGRKLVDYLKKKRSHLVRASWKGGSKGESELKKEVNGQSASCMDLLQG